MNGGQVADGFPTADYETREVANRQRTKYGG